MSNNFSSSLKTMLEDRIANPFWGSFAISWLAWNFKIVLILFMVDGYTNVLDASRQVYEVSTLVDCNMSENPIGCMVIANAAEKGWLPWFAWPFMSLLVLPFISAIFLMTIVPWILFYPYKFSKFTKSMYEKARVNALDETPITIAKARELRAEIRELGKEILGAGEDKENAVSFESERVREELRQEISDAENDKSYALSQVEHSKVILGNIRFKTELDLDEKLLKLYKLVRDERKVEYEALKDFPHLGFDPGNEKLESAVKELIDYGFLIQKNGYLSESSLGRKIYDLSEYMQEEVVQNILDGKFTRYG